MAPVLVHQGFDRSMTFLTFPELILLVAITSAAYAWFDIQALMNKGYSLIVINGLAMACGGIGALITSYAYEGWDPVPVVAWIPFIKSVALLIFVSNILFYNLFGSLLRRYSITFVTFIGFLTPIFASLFGWLFLHETITWHYGVSLLLLIGALALFNSDTK
jgi:drug/metabolite transporter (DMT)-like permease